MPSITHIEKQNETRVVRKYSFQQVDNQRWGIYIQDRLLATIGSYEACKSIQESLDKNMSYSDALRAAIAYKKSINRSLSVG